MQENTDTETLNCHTMTYNFDQCPDRRGTESVKWDLYPGTLPLWVADMDFKVAPEIQEALQKRLEHGVFGYELVPDSYFEAAEIDGASKWQTFWYITMPLLKETIRTALVFFFINAFSGVFTLVNVMTDGAPAKSTEVMTNYMYRIAFQQSNMGYATAIGVVVFLFVLFLTGIMLLLTRSKDVLEY